EGLVGHDQLVHILLAQDVRKGLEPAEHRKDARIPVRCNRAEKLVADAAPIRPERAAQLREALALADEHGAPAGAAEPQDIASENVVARAQDADKERTEDERRRREAVRREVITGAEPERERDHGDEDEREDDLA